MAAQRVEVVSDVVCPWCLIGTRRLDRAIEAGRHDVEVVFRPFLLDPQAAPEGGDLRDHLRRKYGDPEPMFRRVEAVAKADGIPLDFARVTRFSSTVGAHTLLRHAATRGTQHALARALFGAYFLEGRDVGAVEVLTQLGAAHGFEAPEAAALLADPEEASATRREASSLAQRGVRGVPFFIFEGGRAVSGAQPLEVFSQALAG